MSAGIIMSGLGKRYGAHVALSEVDLTIEPGEFVTILGPSGSGKTTLLNLLAGFLAPSSGSIQIGGRDITTLPPHQRNLGMVFQNYALFPHMSVAENVGYPLRVRKVNRRARADAVQAALETVRMGGFADRTVGALSGGQRQRIALARAIVFEPSILLMDEPLSALDKTLREEMQDELRKLHARLGMTVLCVTHDQEEALALSDRIAVIGQGRLQQFDTPRALYSRPTNAFVARFMGRGDLIAPQLLDWPDSALPARDRRLLLRDESLHWQPPVGGAAARIRARVADVTYLGSLSRVQLDLPDGSPIVALHDGRSGVALPEPGAQVDLFLPVEDAILLPGEAA